MGGLQRFLQLVSLWYHTYFWNLYTESTKTKNHPIALGAFFLRDCVFSVLFIHFPAFFSVLRKLWNEGTAEIAAIVFEPVEPRVEILPKDQGKHKAIAQQKNPLILINQIKKRNKKNRLSFAAIYVVSVIGSLIKSLFAALIKFAANYFFIPLKKVSTGLLSFILSVILFPFAILRRPKNSKKLYYIQKITSFLALLAGIIGSGYSVYTFAFADLPPVTDLVERHQRVTTRILDRNDETLFKIYEDENRTLIKLEDLPPHVIQATIAIEDKYFFKHWGFSLTGITRAFIANAKDEPIQGGSTITQQLVKNRLLTPERTLKRKVREFILSIIVTRTYSKEEVLEMYLNQVAYGGATYGIEEAAQSYFGKPAKELSLAEASMLAGLPQAPSIYSPFGSRPELAYARQDEVLRRMVEDGYIGQNDLEAAKSEVLQFRGNTIDIKAPHFVMYVRELLAEQFGEKVINQDGLEVRTSLDLNLHTFVQETVTKDVESLKNLRVQNGAALVTKPSTGEVLAMVGSTNYFNFENDGQVNVALRPRQPGSSIKPITYALALSKGKTPNSILDDTPITYQVAGSKPYSPRNYDGKFHGRVSLRESLGSSYNIPAVKLLAEYGMEPMITLATKMGISTWGDSSRFGLSLTLGGGEVIMTDLAEVYGTFANYGQTVPLNPILEVKNSQGEVLYRNTCALDGYGCPQTRSLDARVAYQITDILSDNKARTPAFGPQSVLTIPGQQVAVKTGTTNNLRDNWTFGYTSEYLVATWVGNNDNTSMSYIASGVTGASPMWNTIMRSLLSEEKPHKFPTPDGMIQVSICLQTGTLACKSCPTIVQDVFIPGTEPKVACNPSYFKPKDSSEKSQSTPSTSTSTQTQVRDQILQGWGN